MDKTGLYEFSVDSDVVFVNYAQFIVHHAVEKANMFDFTFYNVDMHNETIWRLFRPVISPTQN